MISKGHLCRDYGLASCTDSIFAGADFFCKKIGSATRYGFRTRLEEEERVITRPHRAAIVVYRACTGDWHKPDLEEEERVIARPHRAAIVVCRACTGDWHKPDLEEEERVITRPHRAAIVVCRACTGDWHKPDLEEEERLIISTFDDADGAVHYLNFS